MDLRNAAAYRQRAFSALATKTIPRAFGWDLHGELKRVGEGRQLRSTRVGELCSQEFRFLLQLLNLTLE